MGTCYADTEPRVISGQQVVNSLGSSLGIRFSVQGGTFTADINYRSLVALLKSPTGQRVLTALSLAATFHSASVMLYEGGKLIATLKGNDTSSCTIL